MKTRKATITKRTLALLLSLALAFALLPAVAAYAVEVTDATAFVTAIGNAQDGDIISISAEEIALSDAITINRNLNITITSSATGGTNITAATGKRHIVISGSQLNVAITFSGVTLQGCGNDQNGGGIEIAKETGTVTLIGANITGNKTNQFGGGIYSDESNTLALTDSHVNDNSADSFGGGIYCAMHNNLTLTNSTVNNNTAGQNCGGIWLADYGTLQITNSEVSGNTANGSGFGGIGLLKGTETIIDGSTISNNKAPNGKAGGIGNYSTLTISDSTITGNEAKTDGGGIYNDGNNESAAVLAITNSNVSDNTASDGTGADLFVGTTNTGNDVILIDTTIPNNTTGGSGSVKSMTYKIPGVTAPVAGAEPVSSIEATEYTGAITWAPTVTVGGTFAYSTVYTATITLTAKRGYSLDSVAAGSFAVDGARAANDENIFVVTAEFPATESPRSSGFSSSTPNSTPTPTPEPEIDIIDEGPALAAFTPERVAYITGYPDGTVRPDGELSRGDAAMMLWRLLGDADEDGAVVPAFSDIAIDAYYAQAVMYLSDSGIITGYDDGTFRPDKKITRAEFTVILSRFDTSESAAAGGFDDAAGHWAESYINNAVEKGWINGYPDGTFRPDIQITRAQSAAIINRMLGLTLDTIPDDAPVFSDLSENHWAYTDLIIATYVPAEVDAPEDEDTESADDTEDADLEASEDDEETESEG
jgi:hypothetical protein